MFPEFITINVGINFGKEVNILKSKLSNNLYESFVATYQTCLPAKVSLQYDQPFVYVSPDGEIRLVTEMMNSKGGEDEIFAVSIANDGFVEFLAFHES